MSFFKRWWKATKARSTSPEGSLETQLIITFFVFTGCWLGALQAKYLFNSPSYVSFLLFAFGALQGYTFWLLVKQKKAMKEQKKVMDELRKNMEEK
ncbi:MAG TPA: hypothetical protein PLT65_05535 [Bacilli bacterium]|nr:hypothetical protein [Bacilli bacterium]